MKNVLKIRKVTALLIITLVGMFTFVTNVSAKNISETTNEIRSVQTNEFTLKSNTSTTTVRLTRSVIAGSTQKTYQVVKTGNNCTVVVRFVNQSSGATYTLALTANNGQYTEGIGVTIPAGTYTVSFASVPCTVSNCWCVFKF